MQLLLTTIVAGACAYTPVIRTTLHSNPWIFLACLPISIVLIIALHIKRHQVPINFFLLGAFTIMEAITVGVVVSLYEVESVVKALCLTTAITVSLTLYTLQSKRDFSKMGTALMTCLIVVFGMGIMNLFMASKGMDLIIAGVAAILFSFFIVYDTHMMMNKLSPEEYILATINLYLDIINLFLELLRIFGERRN
ncbi:UNVERIFIED_CONTAM: hypothetical protein GTU68_013019 [Idotea baltica]|nr:hypothetical protein [Idotea baltica]